MARLIYSLLLYLILPFTPLKLLWRGIRQPAYRQHWAERYGFYSVKPSKPLIWLHCVSVGETRAATPLVIELQNIYPDHQILLTHATPTGREAGEQLFGEQVLRAYLPYDVPGAVSRFVHYFKPDIGLIMETELWFNLIAACKRQQVPLLLVNARLSQRSAAGYANVSRLVGQGLANLAAVAAQTEQDAERLQSLGAQNVSVTGNLKFEVTPPADAAHKGDQLRAVLGKNRPLFLAASTRDGEEALIIEAVTAANIPNLLTVIVPRHPQRFDEVANLLNKRGLHYVRRSGFAADLAGQATLSTSVDYVLGDSMGEMFTYYAASDVVFIGGSLQPLGGQNLIEASAMSKPVLIGPHTFNFALATEMAIAAGAAWRVHGTDDLSSALKRLMTDPERREGMSLAALHFSTSAGGACHKIVALVNAILQKA